MEAEFLEIDENGSWNAIYQVGTLDMSRWKAAMGEAVTFWANIFLTFATIHEQSRTVQSPCFSVYFF